MSREIVGDMSMERQMTWLSSSRLETGTCSFTNMVYVLPVPTQHRLKYPARIFKAKHFGIICLVGNTWQITSQHMLL